VFSATDFHDNLEFPLYSVFRDGKHAIPRWGLKKHAHPNVVGNVKNTLPSVGPLELITSNVLKINTLFYVTEMYCC